MTDRERNAWIAEHVMDWKRQDPFETTCALWFEHPDHGTMFTTDKCDVSNFRCFSFVDDLNLCREAEVKIGAMGLAADYILILLDPEYIQENRLAFPGAETMFKMVTATARQRCEAMYAIRDLIAKVRESE
jgi:hypothetical protein